MILIRIMWMWLSCGNRSRVVSYLWIHIVQCRIFISIFILYFYSFVAQALVSFKGCMPPPLPYYRVDICPFPLPHFASMFLACLWSFRWPNCVVALPRCFSFRLPHLDVPAGSPSDELDRGVRRASHFLFFSQWNGYNHFRFALDFSYAFRIL